MSLEQTLKTVVRRLNAGQLDNEAQVKQAVILPILRALDWDDTDPETFRPEYSVGRGLVDYALLDRCSPLIFIEAKRVGAMDAGGEEQLFVYGSNRGVPFLVLTDGNRWDFYLSMAPGVPSERRFCRLELQLEHKIPDYVNFLEDHVRRERVISGDARLNAERRHKSNRERTRAREAIPTSWQALLGKPHETIRDLLVEWVESECGTKPELDDVETFLKNLRPNPLRSSPVSQPPIPSALGKTPTQTAQRSKRSRVVGFIYCGEEVQTGTGIETLAEILATFERQDPGFMERFAARTVSRTRALVARNRSDLYDKSHLVDQHSKNLGNGWWLGTNLSKAQIIGHVRTACNEANVEFGSTLKLIER